MPKKKPETQLLTVTEVIARAANSHPHCSPGGIRRALTSGAIPALRASEAKKARYRVRWSDVATYLDSLNKNHA